MRKTPNALNTREQEKEIKIVLLKLTTRILTTFEVFGAAGIALFTLLFTFVV